MTIAHSDVRNEAGIPITGPVYDSAVDVLVTVVAEHGVPDSAINELKKVIDPPHASGEPHRAGRGGPRPETLRRRHARIATPAQLPAPRLPLDRDDPATIHRAGPATAEGRITPPAPGTAVLACRCGAVLSLPDMHRPRAGARPPARSGPTVEPIRCRSCAIA